MEIKYNWLSKYENETVITVDWKQIRRWAIDYNEKPKTTRGDRLTEEKCNRINVHEEITIIYTKKKNIF